MKELGIRKFRMSIAWPRILPNGTGAVNQEGINFYIRVVDALIDAGIEPYVTLYHWDLPQARTPRTYFSFYYFFLLLQKYQYIRFSVSCAAVLGPTRSYTLFSKRDFPDPYCYGLISLESSSSVVSIVYSSSQLVHSMTDLHPSQFESHSLPSLVSNICRRDAFVTHSDSASISSTARSEGTGHPQMHRV